MVGGRAYWSQQQLVTGVISALLLTWGLVWVLQVVGYGVCTREIDDLAQKFLRKEAALSHGAILVQNDVYALTELAAELQEQVTSLQGAVRRNRIPLVVMCSAESLEAVPAHLFALHVATTQQEYESCERRHEHLSAVHIELLQEHHTLFDAVRDVLQREDYPIRHAVMWESGAVAPDGFAFLHAVAEQGVLGEKEEDDRSDVVFASAGTLGDLPVRPQQPAGKGASQLPPLMEQLVVKRRAVPAGAFLFRSHDAGRVADAAREQQPLVGVEPLLPRGAAGRADLPSAPAHAGYVHPVLFASLDLRYLQSDTEYLKFLRKQAKRAGAKNHEHVTSVSLEPTTTDLLAVTYSS